MSEDIVVPVRLMEADSDAETELVFQTCAYPTVHGSMYNNQPCLVLRGHRRDGGQIESGILDILDDDLVKNEVPRDEQARSAPLAASLGC